ncbi:esterase/lipase family protein [Streptomyces sp. NPDC056480]|uniref:esterase/lipase family protein n=1 Tax=Streptomyces sp. NPDC056480 TaxID=3345833 RepID=UPI00368DD67F
MPAWPRRLSSLVAMTCLGSASLLFCAPAQAANTPDPVLFVHGWSGASWNWSLMLGDFRAAGYQGDRLEAISYNTQQSNTETAEEIREAVNRLRARTGSDKVDIISHSMGGLSTRFYLKNLGGVEAVDDWVSIGGPNHGTYTASLCAGFLPSCREMQVGSAFLTDLNSGDETPGDVHYSTLWSWCDEIINPDASTKLNGATNINVGCVGHAALLVDYDVSSTAQQLVRS